MDHETEFCVGTLSNEKHTCGLSRPLQPYTHNLDVWNEQHGFELSEIVNWLDEEYFHFPKTANEIAAEYLEIDYKDVRKESDLLAEHISAVFRWNYQHVFDQEEIWHK